MTHDWGNPEWWVYAAYYLFVGAGPVQCIAWTVVMVTLVLIFVRNPKEK